MKKLLVSLVIFISLAQLSAQELKYCGTDEMRINTLKQANPKIAQAIIKRDQVLEAHTQQFTENFYQKNMAGGMVYTIPVVFHVIHMYGNENISDAQIKDGIDVLNKTFRKQLADTASIVAAFKPLHADCEIEFKLAQLDPNGNCTSGINRIASPLTTTGNHDVKTLIQWPTDMYLNIYVVQNAAGLAGHAIFPSDADSIPAWDGIVMSHNYVGSIGTSTPMRSVVLAHECGHYLNLQHIWGGNNVPNFYYYPCADPFKDCNIDDLVADTPPTIGWQSCNLTAASCGNVVDNVQNAMDYSYCNKMFTYGQKARMQACLNSTIGGRNNLWQPANLVATGVSSASTICAADFNANKKVVCSSSNNQIIFSNASYNGNFTSIEWTFPGGTPSSSTLASPTITYTTPGKHAVSLKVKNGIDSAQITKANFISVLPSSGNPYPYSEDFESTVSLNGNDWFSNSFDTENEWLLTNTTAVSGSNCVMLDNFNTNKINKDELISPIINLTGTSNLSVSFKYAFARKDSTNLDQLQLLLSGNCNTSWIIRATLSGSGLETVPPTNTFYTPTSVSEWRQVYATIPASFLTASFRFKFLFTSNGGNNIYIDDINITNTLNIAEQSTNNFHVHMYPNPSKDVLNITINTEQSEKIMYSIKDVVGKTVAENNIELVKGENLFSINNEKLTNGFYFIQFSGKSLSNTQSFIIQRN
ncbi:MAG: PKD domain-containing protein [Bacteroidia bacterium]|nr:PKD domain-containing protein [Bacteroidia bacterium]